MQHVWPDHRVAPRYAGAQTALARAGTRGQVIGRSRSKAYEET
jgi:hypothetical protein